MQFAALALAALASVQAAPTTASSSKDFGALAIRSGSGLQFESIIAEGEDLYFGPSTNAQTASVTDCGFLQFKDGSYAYVETDGSFKKGSREDAMPGFIITDGNLKYYNNDLFGVKDGDQYRVSSKSNSDDSLGVLIRAIDPENGANVIPDYTPDGKDCWALGPPTSFTAAPIN